MAADFARADVHSARAARFAKTAAGFQFSSPHTSRSSRARRHTFAMFMFPRLGSSYGPHTA